MVEGDLLIGRRLVGREDPAYDIGPRRGSPNVRQLLVPERLDDVVEVGSGVYREAPEQQRPGLVDQRLEVRLLGLDGLGQKRGRGSNPSVRS